MKLLLDKGVQSGRLPLALLAILFCGVMASRLDAQLGKNQLEAVELTNGMRFIGRIGSLEEMGATNVNVTSEAANFGIYLVEDELRDVFFSRFNVANTTPYDRQETSFEIWQKVHKGDANNSAVGEIIGIGPFDNYGRRTITTMTSRGPETVLQGITEISPRYVRLQGLVNQGEGKEEQWDMRVSLNSIPVQVLEDVLHLQIKDRDNANERLRLVDFFAQAQKFSHAERELMAVRRDFPGLRNELEKRSELLSGQVARQMLDEARLRADAGQTEIAGQLIKPLLTRADLPGAVLADVFLTRDELNAEVEKIDKAKKQFEDLANRAFSGNEIADEVRKAIEPVVDEIKGTLRSSNLDRLATFARLADDPQLSDSKKLSLAITGWIVGAGNANENPGISQSLALARPLVIEYLTTAQAQRRTAIIAELEQQEGGAVNYIDLILKHILPPNAPSPGEITSDKPMEIEIEYGAPSRKASYLIQLPPQYDPWRKYPCIVTLGASTDSQTTPEAQIDWWCGPMLERFGIRNGHASRHGYIVIAPRWTRPNQLSYEFSQREQAIVLKSLRDATRRFSIDTDRVFLTGHFVGATAAWDLGQSHPEHWAGVMPISARAERYINHTYKNGKEHCAWYFVNGGRDFTSRDLNANVWNNRMRTREFQTVIVLIRGRGAEKFGDELPNLFQWMSVQRRRPGVESFECSTLRPWNNNFWWLELDLTNNPKMVAPQVDWDAARRDDWLVTGERKVEQNILSVRGIDRDASAVVWMSPENVDFAKDVRIQNSGRNFSGEVKPSRRVILEDARTRSDLQHAWWASVRYANKNWSVDK